jgi:hypothetical protein
MFTSSAITSARLLVSLHDGYERVADEKAAPRARLSLRRTVAPVATVVET